MNDLHDPAVDPPRFDITAPLPTGTTVLEASAGTGKTWTIAALVARYVAEGVVPLERMLVVTFGRAASQELRERVRDQLVEVDWALGRALAGESPPDPGPLLSLLLGVEAEELAARHRRVREALAGFDAATIATTHQFCQLVLRSLGIAGDTDASARLVEDLDDLVVEVVDDLYVRGFARSADDPVFDRATALAIGRHAVNDPQARLEPGDGDPAAPTGSPPARRRAFAEAVREELDLRKRRLGILSYDDLLQRLAEALEDPDAPARDRMRGRWSLVLVDEFQDTDPVQWQVLDRAFSGHATMVLIGDPKQAIYAFRGGDVVTYLAARRTATHVATLGVNHRSDQPLLAQTQALIAGLALGDEEIVVRDVEAHHTRSRLSGAPHDAPFRLRLVDQDRFGGTGKGVAVGVLRTAVADDLAADIRALLASGATFEGSPLRAAEVAVLCETRRQCETVRAALAKTGVPAVVSGGGSVFATEGADEWLALLEALAQPHRSALVRAAALTSFFGCSALDLDEQGEELTSRCADTLRDWADLLRTRGVAAVFEVTGCGPRVLARPQGERLLTDLRHVAEAIHDVAVRERLTLAALLAWLRSQMDEARANVAGERTRRLDNDAAAVQILTIHGSKGLQFPVVYLPFVADTHKRPPDFPLYHDGDTRCLDVGGAQTGAAAAVAEEAGEDLRLFYVALTRAQSQVVAWWIPSQRNTPPSPLHRVLFGRGPGEPHTPSTVALVGDDQAREMARRWEEAGGPRVELLAPALVAVPPLVSPPVALQCRDWTREVDAAWRRTSYTGLSSAAEAASPLEVYTASAGGDPVASFGSEPEDPPRDDEPALGAVDVTGGVAARVASPMADLPVGASFGSLVHGVLEHSDPAAPDRAGDLRAELLHHIHEQLGRWPVPGLAAEPLADALDRVCRTPLGPLLPDTTLATLPREDRLTELDFELPLGGGDCAEHPWTPGRLSELATLWRRHLPDDDPLAPFGDVLARPGYAAQILSGYLAGSLDLVLRRRVGGEQRFFVADYKTNWLGGEMGGEAGGGTLYVDHYAPTALAAAMSHSTYPLQATLYAVVLHRFLRWRLPGYDPERHLGGVLYLYVRGMAGPQTPVVDGHPCGVFSWRPPASLAGAVSDLLDGVGA